MLHYVLSRKLAVKFQKILIVLNISHRIQQRATYLVKKAEVQFIL